MFKPSYRSGRPPIAGSAFPLDVTSIPTKAVWPYAAQWSFGVQRELPSAFVFNVAYVGSKGTHLTIERQLNQLKPVAVSENPFGPNEPLTIADCTALVPGTSGTVPGNGIDPFLLQNGTLVTPQSPAYMYLQAACTNPISPTSILSLAALIQVWEKFWRCRMLLIPAITQFRRRCDTLAARLRQVSRTLLATR